MTSLPHEGTRFTLQFGGLPEDLFSVVRFSGTETLNSCYHFTLTLAAGRPCDPFDILHRQAVLHLHKGAEERNVFGVPLLFKRIGEYGPHRTHYQMLLGPRLERLKYVRSNRVFINKTIKSCISEILVRNNIDNSSFEFRLEKNYPTREFICQYEEDDYAFIARWLEYYGMTYYFDHGAHTEKLIITDSLMGQQAAPGLMPLPYAPQAGLEQAFRRNVVSQCFCKTRLGPQNARVRDFNYRKPDILFESKKPVSGRGHGQAYYYSEDLVSQAEAELIAGVRAEALACRLQLYHGSSSSILVQAGFHMTIKDHFNPSFNRELLITKLTHEGRQHFDKTAGMDGSPPDVQQPGYSNRFEAIPAETPFRPERKTAQPRIQGTLHGRIDAKGSGQYAELDSQGRYKVVFPFDLSGQENGQASHWIRLSQPYAGKDFGFHFPLLKGTEVVLAFIDGNPDRPMIIGALPNPTQKSRVTSANNTQCVLQTAGRNLMQFENTSGSEYMRMSSPTASSSVHFGAATSGAVPGITIRTQGNQQTSIGQNQSISVGGNASKLVKGAATNATTGSDTFNVMGDDTRCYKQQHGMTTQGAAANNNTTITIETSASAEEIALAASDEYDACGFIGDSLVLYNAAKSDAKGTKSSDKNIKISVKSIGVKAQGAASSTGIITIGLVLAKLSVKVAEARALFLRFDVFRSSKGFKGLVYDVGAANFGIASTKQDIDGTKIDLNAKKDNAAGTDTKIDAVAIVSSGNNKQV